VQLKKIQPKKTSNYKENIKWILISYLLRGTPLDIQGDMEVFLKKNLHRNTSEKKSLPTPPSSGVSRVCSARGKNQDFLSKWLTLENLVLKKRSSFFFGLLLAF